MPHSAKSAKKKTQPNVVYVYSIWYVYVNLHNLFWVNRHVYLGGNRLDAERREHWKVTEWLEWFDWWKPAQREESLVMFIWFFLCVYVHVLTLHTVIKGCSFVNL